MGGFKYDGIECPVCRSAQNEVIDSRPGVRYHRRRRRCLQCGEKFSTYEVSVIDYKNFLDYTKRKPCSGCEEYVGVFGVSYGVCKKLQIIVYPNALCVEGIKEEEQ